MDIPAMQEEVYKWAESKGWEPDPGRTFGDECALIHSEISEALEAYRTWKFEDGTDRLADQSLLHADLSGRLPKPEGVASELADVLIRLLHYSACGRFGLYPPPPRNLFNEVLDSNHSFGECITIMHSIVSESWKSYPSDVEMHGYYMNLLYWEVHYFCEQNGFDLEAEYRRKMDFNYTRAYRHGNRAM